MTRCPVCGGTAFTSQNVLWLELCEAWSLSALEIEYINRQQGFACKGCGNNLRSMAMAKAILCHWNDRESLALAVAKDRSG